MTGILVFIGGMLGGALRYSLLQLISTPVTNWLGLLLINLLGSGLLTFWNRYGLEQLKLRPALLTAGGMGVLGGFTSYSAFSLDFLKLLLHQQWILAGFYVILTIAGSLLAAFLGNFLAQRLIEFHR
ncbi:CrcB family protein [Lactobacillus sp. DCY120]|uniref:Fluoride-specific ion channel FluC n=1 Tax=Bombilactobacillus apium TaxID=2675299 RepID=A0A850QV23_9LACO|nr:CrcB family protein [Bombilactobacillus apium]NVY95624.1 CrcB family protein [Bombilactobacillus apium]